MERLPVFMTAHAKERFSQRSRGIRHPLIDELQTARPLTRKQQIRYSRNSRPNTCLVATANFILVLERASFMSIKSAWKCLTIYRKARRKRGGDPEIRPLRDIEPSDLPELPLFTETYNTYTIEEELHDRDNHIAEFIRPDTGRSGEIESRDPGACRRAGQG